MKKVIIFTVILFCSFNLFAQNWTGTWDTSYGELRLVQIGDIVYGDYNNGEGTIDGKLNKKFGILNGEFYNEKAKKTGKFTFILWNGDSFKGSWNWFNSSLKEDWSGTKTSSEYPILLYYGKFDDSVWTGTWETDFGPITLNQFGSRVNGDYIDANGWIRASYHKPSRILSGIFFNKNSNRTGRFEFFLEKFDKSFTGKWSWDELEPTSKWNGKKALNISKKIINEDCIPINYTALKIIPENGKYLISDGSSRMLLIDDKKEAEQILKTINNYQFTSTCYVGRPNPSFSYCLASNKAPRAKNLAGEDCLSFNNKNLKVELINNKYTITDGSHLLFSFGQNKEEADLTLDIIRQHGFNQSCFVGRPNPSFQYLTIR
ncbi:MAG: hypothetical protein ACOCWM_00500 [Cyclobacteriaceae bacterium]